MQLFITMSTEMKKIHVKKLTRKVVKAILPTLLINSIQLLCVARYSEINGLVHQCLFFSICVNTIYVNEYDA